MLLCHDAFLVAMTFTSMQYNFGSNAVLDMSFIVTDLNSRTCHCQFSEKELGHWKKENARRCRGWNGIELKSGFNPYTLTALMPSSICCVKFQGYNPTGSHMSAHTVNTRRAKAHTATKSLTHVATI